MPAALAERAPWVVELDSGSQAWTFEGRLYPNVGLNAVGGPPRRRSGAWTRPASRRCARAASTSTPGSPTWTSGIPGLGVFPVADLRLLRAPSSPGPRIPSWAWRPCGPGTTGISSTGRGTHPIGSSRCNFRGWPTSRSRPPRCARNAGRGLSGRQLPQCPTQLGFPSMFTGGAGDRSSPPAPRREPSCACTPARPSWAPLPSPDPPFELLPTLFPVNACRWRRPSGCGRGTPVRFPDLAIALSEGGMPWVPMLMDRVDFVVRHSASGNESGAWRSPCSRATCSGAISRSA